MKPRPASKQTTALTLIEVIVIVAVVVILAGLLVLALTPFHVKASRSRCVNNLKQLGVTFRLWAGDHEDKFPMSVSVTNEGTMEFALDRDVFFHFLAMSNELNAPEILACPADEERKRAMKFDSNFNNGNVSYFLNVDAEAASSQMFLAGDRNLAVNDIPLKPGLANLTTNDLLCWTEKIHNKQGNMLFADGSVQQLTTTALQKALQTTGAATNRLVIP
jgi:prepilin-type processing-associated H-X9-DG protein